MNQRLPDEYFPGNTMFMKKFNPLLFIDKEPILQYYYVIS